ncbi:frigida-LIKE protein [Medicago truncatula]|uniref:FRIGIDA-like protein n=1 Tax=Medicago truncatula TaxID=3880 RepID=A0A072VCB2_MEDTR|nr:frigida-LIKE protein [Medicago truncatula]
MDFEASNKLKFCVGDDEGRFNFKRIASCEIKTSHSASREDFESEDEDDDVPLSARFPQLLNLGTSSNNNHDGHVKKKYCPTLPIKRMLFDSSNSLCDSVKKSKVSSYDDNDDDDDDVPISSRIKVSAMSTDKSISLLKKELAFVEKSIDECKRKRQVEEKRLQSIKRNIEERSKELENKKKEITCVGRINEACKKMQGKIDECVKDFVAKEGQLYLMEDLIGERKQELKTKELELREVMDNISKQKEFESQVKELVNDLVSKQKHFESRIKELESKEKQLDGRVKGFESKEDEFEGQVKKLESEKKHFESRLKELESMEKEFTGLVKKFKKGKEEFKGQVKELKSKKKKFEIQVEDFKTKEKQFEKRWKELESKENNPVKELKLKEKQLEVEAKDLESKLNKHDGQSKEHDLTEKQYGPLIKYFDEEIESATSYMDDEISPTIDGTSLQLLPSDKSDILDNLQESSDPAKIVLDIIQNPIIPRYKNGDHAVIIDGSCIFLLEQLMRISPKIKPCVREEALKLAHDLKAKIKENTENSLVVLGFLLVLSIYGLVTSFDKDEVLELFAFVAQHKTAVELFRTLGFANKVSVHTVN